MMDWHVVVAASKGYEPGLRALLNSYFHYHKESKTKVHVLLLENLKIDDVFYGGPIQQGDPGLHNIPVNRINVVDIPFTETKNYPGKNTAWSTKIPRFKYAAGLEGVVMLVDADLFICANWDHWFRMAELGYIIGGSNGSNVRYHGEWRKKYGLDVPDFFNHKTICSIPTLLRPDLHGQVWKDLYEHKINGSGIGADFDLQNIFMTIHKKTDQIISLPSQQTTGIHHFQLKMDTGVTAVDGKLMTRDGLEVLSVHGKWWQPGWRRNVLMKMKDYYCVNIQRDNRALGFAEKSWGISCREFQRWSGEKFDLTKPYDKEG
jgi:hypothetical protein